MSTTKLTGKYQLSKTITINTDRQSVWNVMRDFGNVYTWAPTVVESHSITPKETGVGAGRYCKIDGFGEIKEYVHEWNDGFGFVYDVSPIGPLAKSYNSWTLTSAENDKTQLTVTFYYNLRFGVLGQLMHALMMRKKLEEGVQGAMEALKKRVETGELVRPFKEHIAAA